MHLFVPMWMTRAWSEEPHLTKVLFTPGATLSIAAESQEKLKIG